MRQGSKTLTEHELEIMKVIWQHRQATVRQVYEALLQERPVAYTTVSTMMKILEGKGHLEKQPEGRAYLYRPTESRQKVISSLVGDFLDRVFDGSARPLLLSLIEDRKVSSRDLEVVAELIDSDELVQEERAALESRKDQQSKKNRESRKSREAEDE